MGDSQQEQQSEAPPPAPRGGRDSHRDTQQQRDSHRDTQQQRDTPEGPPPAPRGSARGERPPIEAGVVPTETASPRGPRSSVDGSGVPPRRSSLRKAEDTRRTPPETSSESIAESTPRVKGGAESPPPDSRQRSARRSTREIIAQKAAQEELPPTAPRGGRRQGTPPAKSPETAALHSSHESLSSEAAAEVRAPKSALRRRGDDTAAARRVSTEARGEEESPGRRQETAATPAEPAPSPAGEEGDAIADSADTPAVVHKEDEDPTKKGTDKPSSRRKENSGRSARLSAADEKLVQSTQRVEKLERMLLVPSTAAVQTFLPSIANPGDLRKFVEGDLALSILRRLEALAKTAGMTGQGVDLQFHPFWVETSNRGNNEKVLKLIHDFLFKMSDNNKNNEVIVREKSNEIADLLKSFNPDVSNQWAQNVLTEMSRLRSQSQMLAWIGSIMQKRCRAAILGLDSRVTKLQYSLEAPLNSARIMEGWTEIESRKTFVLENEQVIRFIADQCRRIEEMSSVNVASSLPSKDTLSTIRTRLDKLQDEVSSVTKQVADFDAQLIAVSEKIQTANQLFTSVVLGMAA
eukprot:Gregarina_sp_Pseudo_9__2035@NODE_240_length_3462_cov_14_410459_g224_i0_p1_GENE_NODE_240_length_3462_cov_14_410459_g224_i0NODE_240_length_3462_cov_14_410459_g224_i0_p1_ORF_typecomplete_len578_score137_81Dynactin_p22/PF07426_11/2_6e03Dynactin_p22/PF07426_11/0_0027DUF2730/PF10805_8/1_8e02DUF2730/PF10805_8/0_13MAP65_ASE1/PF03999_12/1_8e04MAP65_ASE1/PF03999_12/0_014NPV_P10/PF05531_12/9_3e03NPV_P10/PF05531_12/4_3e02NPV_P10/PF05531_12/2ENTH/PF01417_20/1_1ENTH/PF01417_20/7_6e02Baculo_PEP_C/PF04513_12/5_